jgi:hypothetical protein
VVLQTSGLVLGAGALLLAVLAALSGCSSQPEPASEPANPLIFEIVNSDGEIEGWMLGTIHALPDGTDWRTPAIERAVDAADYLMVEVANLDDRGAIAATFTRLATTPGLPDLPLRVAPSQRAALNALVSRSAARGSTFSTTETWAAAIMLAQVDAEGNPENGVDRALIRDFAGRDVREFEGAADQLVIFDRLPERDQRDLLEGVVREASDENADRGRLRRAWLSGDIAVLEEATNTGIMADPELRAALLVDRNTRWLALLAGELRAPERPLVAVGAAHLVGPDGLPAMLEARGYIVRRVD